MKKLSLVAILLGVLVAVASVRPATAQDATPNTPNTAAQEAANPPASAPSNTANAPSKSTASAMPVNDPAPAAPSASKRMTNDDVVSLVSAGLSPDIVIAKIRAANGADGLNFDTSVDGLKSLKSANVPDSVIAAMINPTPAPTVIAASAPMTMDPNLPPPEVGVYWKDGGAFNLIPGFALTNEKVGGRAGAFFTNGIRGEHWDATIDGPTSKNVVKDRHPIFYIYVPDGNSASDYQLLAVNKKEDHREFQVGTFGGFTGGKSGVKKDKQVQFTAEHVGIRVYKITIEGDLKPGEYAFFMGTGTTAAMSDGLGAARSGGNALGRVYDFSIPQ